MSDSRELSGSLSDSGQSYDLEQRRFAVHARTSYPRELERRGCIMSTLKTSPDPEDVAFYQRLLQHKSEQVPSGTMFDYGGGEYALEERSRTCILVNLHPLLVPCTGAILHRGCKHLSLATDDYDDTWTRIEPIIGPRPRPAHFRCLSKYSAAFTPDDRRKIEKPPVGGHSYILNDKKLCFPYLTCEVVTDMQPLEPARRQNMHSMSIALRSLVQLAEAAGTPEKVHLRILGFSISHDIEAVEIFGHYPELDGKQTKYHLTKIAYIPIWLDDNRWKCYSFVEALDNEFLPIHIARVKEMLERIDLPNLDENIKGQPEPASELQESIPEGEEPGQSAELQFQLDEYKREREEFDQEMKKRAEEFDREMKESDERHKKWREEFDREMKERDERHKKWQEEFDREVKESKEDSTRRLNETRQNLELFEQWVNQKLQERDAMDKQGQEEFDRTVKEVLDTWFAEHPSLTWQQ